MRAHWVTPVIRLLLLALLFAAAVSPKTRHRKRRSKSSLDAAAHFDEQLGEVFGFPNTELLKDVATLSDLGVSVPVIRQVYRSLAGNDHWDIAQEYMELLHNKQHEESIALLTQLIPDFPAAADGGSAADMETCELPEGLDVESGMDMEKSTIGFEELQEHILEAFLASDEDGGGYLDISEFTWVLDRLGLNLGETDTRKVVEDCDVDNDGIIEYREFIPSMLDLIHISWATTTASAQAEGEQESPGDLILSSINPDRLKMLLYIAKVTFEEHDTDEDGFLSKSDLRSLLKTADIGLPKKVSPPTMLRSSHSEPSGSVQCY